MRRSRTHRVLFVPAISLSCALGLPGAATAGNEPVCPLPADIPPAPGLAPAEPVTLAQSEPTEILNFNGDQDTKSCDVVLRASQPLPPSLTTSQLANCCAGTLKRAQRGANGSWTGMGTAPPRASASATGLRASGRASARKASKTDGRS